MEDVGRLYENGEYFLPELMMSGEILKQINALVKPFIGIGDTGKRVGKVVIGTIKGDIHDIGKNIVSFLLDINGFEVFDLGVDVPAEKFLEKVQEVRAPIVAMSALLTLSYESMKEAIKLLRTGLPGNALKIMIGGGPINERVREFCGADGWGSEAAAAVRLARNWTGSGGKGNGK